MAAPSSTKRMKFSVNVERRQWDVSAYALQAQSRPSLATSAAPPSPVKLRPGQTRAPVQAREKPLALTATLGQSQRVTSQMPLEQQGGYYCSTCQCLLKDSLTYLDHVNGRRHQKMLGTSMRIQRSSTEQVKALLNIDNEVENEKKEVEANGKYKGDAVAWMKRILNDSSPISSASSSSNRKRERQEGEESKQMEEETGGDSAVEKTEESMNGVTATSQPQATSVESSNSQASLTTEDDDEEFMMMRAMNIPATFKTSSKK